ncbi:MAG: aspartate/glutamate racemase family protein [Ignisphaera sp.]
MRILVINPVGHSRWDEQDRRLYRLFASPGTEVEVASLPRGPPSVESPKNHAEVIPLVIDRVLELHSRYDAIVVNCFLDPAVDLLKGMLRKPVVGPCESSLAIASLLSRRIAIVSVGGDALWMIEDRVNQLGYRSYVTSIRGIELSVLQLDEEPEKTKEMVIKVARESIDGGAEVIVLGCTGLAGIAEAVGNAIGRPVIDPVGAAVKMAETMVRLRLYSPRARG